MSSSDRYREVYSTDQGSICSSCGKPRTSCSCSSDKRMEVRGDGNVRVRRETKGRGGKTVTTISGLALNRDELKALLTHLKRLVGGGGAEKEGTLELQGDHCDLVIQELSRRGIKAKQSGG